MRVGVVLGLSPSPSKAVPVDEVRNHLNQHMQRHTKINPVC